MNLIQCDGVKQRIKMKKNANDKVDFEQEKKNDPKYKTELCHSWVTTKFCIYGNKCRFAHGKEEVYSKPVNTSKYKVKKCTSFFVSGYCQYGNRCHFKHDERSFEDITIPVYFLGLQSKTSQIYENEIENCKTKVFKRLKVFEKTCNSKEVIGNTSNSFLKKEEMNFLQKNMTNIQNSNSYLSSGYYYYHPPQFQNTIYV